VFHADPLWRGVARYRHIPQLLALAEAEFVGLIDPSTASIETTREAFPRIARLPVFSDYHDALQSVQADAAIIASPHNQHLEHGLACLDAGLHVLMEKPFVVGSANAARLIAHARDARRHLAIAYQRHVEGAYMYLHDLVRSGAPCRWHRRIAVKILCVRYAPLSCMMLMLIVSMVSVSVNVDLAAELCADGLLGQHSPSNRGLRHESLSPKYCNMAKVR